MENPSVDKLVEDMANGKDYEIGDVWKDKNTIKVEVELNPKKDDEKTVDEL